MYKGAVLFYDGYNRIYKFYGIKKLILKFIVGPLHPLYQESHLSIPGLQVPQEPPPIPRTLRAIHDQFRVQGGTRQRPVAPVVCYGRRLKKAQGNCSMLQNYC